MVAHKKSHWVDRISEQTLRIITLVLMFSELAVNASGLGYMFKNVFLVMCCVLGLRSGLFIG